MKVLVVDDSLVFRHIVIEALRGERDVKVVGSVRNGVKAMEFIAARRPDLITLDMEMPEMDGLETLAEIQKLNAGRSRRDQIGVIVVSAYTRAGGELTVRALERGAFDFVPKPTGTNKEASIEQLKQKLLPLVRAFGASLRPKRDGGPLPAARLSAAGKPKALGASHRATKTSFYEAICVGVSTGGPRALQQMLPALIKATTLPIFIVQHMPAMFVPSLAQDLSRSCGIEVKEAVDGQAAEPSTVYLAPGGRHLVLSRGAQGELITRITDTPLENACRPSVDVLFRSAASVCKGKVVAIVLTGMGNDGAKSLPMLRREGAYIIAQDEESSVVWGMPGSAVATGCVDRIATLMSVPLAVRRVLRDGGRR